MQRVARGWPGWAVLITALYVLISWLGLARPLISTEVWALHYAGQPLGVQMEAVRQDLVHSPLIYLVERGWLAAFGVSDSVVKLLPVVINIPSLFLFTWLAWRIVKQWRVAALLFSATYLTIGSSITIVRMYGLVLLLTLLSLIAWESWRVNPTAGRLSRWVTVMILLVYTHYLGFLMLAAFLAIDWLFGTRRRVFAAAAMIPAIAFLPWLFYVLPVYESRGLETNLWWVQMLLRNPLVALGTTAYEYLGLLHWSYRSRFVLTGLACFVHLLVAVLAWRPLRKLWPPSRAMSDEARWFWVAALLVAVPCAMLAVFSVTIMPALSPRFLLGMLPAYWLIMVMLAGLAGRAGRAVLYGIVLPWTLLSAAKALSETVRPGPLRENTRLAAKADDSSLILCDAESNTIYWELTRRQGAKARIEFLRPAKPQKETDVVQQRSLAQGERLSVRPLRDLADIDFGGVSRVWYFHGEAKPRADVTAALAGLGFVPGKVSGSGPPFLTVLMRDGAGRF